MIKSTSDSWLVDFSKADYNETVGFYIDQLKKEDIVAAAKVQCGYHGQAQVGFHGDWCYIRKLKAATYIVGRDMSIDTSWTYGEKQGNKPEDLVAEVEQLRKSVERLRFYYRNMKARISEEEFECIQKEWLASKTNNTEPV